MKAPDPMETTRSERELVDEMPDRVLRTMLDNRPIHPNVVDDLVRDRRTNGGRWRIVQELFR